MKKNELISIGERNLQLEIEYKNSYNITSMEHSTLITMLTLFKDKLLKYTKFCHLTLNISMFVPAIFDGGKWVVLEEPRIEDYVFEDHPEIGAKQYDIDEFNKDIHQYQTALDNVIFEGFEAIYNEDRSVECIQSESHHFYVGHLKDSTVENVIKYKPTLTPRGMKDSGIN